MVQVSDVFSDFWNPGHQISTHGGPLRALTCEGKHHSLPNGWRLLEGRNKSIFVG